MRLQIESVKTEIDRSLGTESVTFVIEATLAYVRYAGDTALQKATHHKACAFLMSAVKRGSIEAFSSQEALRSALNRGIDSLDWDSNPSGEEVDDMIKRVLDGEV